jgi:hypothetical protein
MIFKKNFNHEEREVLTIKSVGPSDIRLRNPRHYPKIDPKELC